MTVETSRVTRADVRAVCKGREAWWAVLFFDPLAIRVLPPLMRLRWLTPNLLTATSLVISLGAGALFLAGIPWAGGIVFEVSRFFDNLDGKVARLRRMTSRAGGFFDLSGDLVRMAWGYGAIGAWLAARHEVPYRLALLPAVLVLAWLWSSAQLNVYWPERFDTTAQAFSGRDRWPWNRFNRMPGSIDAAGVALFVAPLTTSPRIIVIVLWVVIGVFYVPATLRNVVKLLRHLHAADVAAAISPGPGGAGSDRPGSTTAAPTGTPRA